MHTQTQDLLAYLTRQRCEVFDLTGRVDDRRYLRRVFSMDSPLLLSHQHYPAYKHMVGENWLHWHDYFEFFVALTGKGDFCAGHDRFFFEAGDIVIVDPLKIHGVMRMDATHTALVILFPRYFAAPTENEIDQAFLSAWEDRTHGTLPVLRANHKATPRVHEAIHRLAEAWYETKPSLERRMNLKLRFLDVLLRLREAMVKRGKQRSVGKDESGLREARLRKALDYISEHGHETLAQAKVAKAAGMSTSRFRAFFKATTGWGFARYLREQRVERAARLLRESSESIASIAHRTGFADQSHLLRCFREKFGVSPKQYRQAHAAE